jgi:hypothetical protein
MSLSTPGSIALVLSNGSDNVLIYNRFQCDPVTGDTEKVITYATLKTANLQEESTKILKKALPADAKWEVNLDTSTGPVRIVGGFYVAQPALEKKKG